MSPFGWKGPRCGRPATKGRRWSRPTIIVGIGFVSLCLLFSSLGWSYGPAFDHVIIDPSGSAPEDPWGKAVGDLNGDGQVDLIAGGRKDGGLVWYENPSWTKHYIDTGGGYSTDHEVVDVDGDGDNDVVTIMSSDVRWYENTSGDGTNWTGHVIALLTQHDVEVADFDGDGRVDLVTRNQGGSGNDLHFYKQNSPLSWSHFEVRIPNGEGLLARDINGDGRVDVVSNFNWYENTGSISAWREHTYTTTWTYKNTFIGLGDMNGDGREDILLSPSEAAGGSYRLSWFEAPPNRANTWPERVIADGLESVHHYVGAGDFDGDGEVDVATAEMHRGTNPNEVKIYYNEGNGQSWTKKEVLASSGCHSMRILDVDSDGDLDLFGANFDTSGSSNGAPIELWINRSDQKLSLSDWQRHVVDADKPWRAVFIDHADIDGDSREDIVTGGWWYRNPGAAEGTWIRNTIGTPLHNMAALYDFDADGDVDILGTEGKGAAANPNFVWAQNNGAGSFTIRSNIASGSGDFLQGVSVGPLVSPNLGIALSWHNRGNGVELLTVPANPESQTWTLQILSSVSQDEDLIHGDIDRDGDLDLLLGTRWLENQGGSWNVQTVNSVGGKPDRNELVDMNGDGKLDAVIGFEAISVAGKLAWYEQGSSPTSPWTEHPISTSVIGPMSLDVRDMDGDGDPDVVVGEHNLSSSSSAHLYVFENLGGATSWTRHTVYTGDEHHDGARLVDIDRDGDLDILSIGWGHGRVILYENQAITGSVAPDTTPPAAIDDLVVTSCEPNSCLLSWTAPGDDGGVGTAAAYDLRYATSVITEASWSSATQVVGLPTPVSAGTAQAKVVDGLAPSSLYYFALKAEDEIPNRSAISNVPSATTLAGADVTAPVRSNGQPSGLLPLGTTEKNNFLEYERNRYL